jgi:hypothetical protein
MTQHNSHLFQLYFLRRIKYRVNVNDMGSLNNVFKKSWGEHLLQKGELQKCPTNACKVTLPQRWPSGHHWG